MFTVNENTFYAYNFMISVEPQPLVYIIVLNYNGYKDSIECFASIEKITYRNYQIVLVDNNSPDGSGYLLSKNYPAYIYIQTGKNLGYAGGNNAGIKLALTHAADYICLLNNDVVVEANFLEPIIALMQEDKTVGIAGPVICEYKNRTIIQSTGANINLYTSNASPLNRGKRKDSVVANLSVAYVGGACLVARKELVENIGLLPEEYFLFFEETEWCWRAGRNKYQIVCVSASCIYHKGSSSVNKTRGLYDYWLARNRIVFEKRNANRLQFLTFAMYNTMMFAASLVKGLITRKPRKDRVRGFIDGIMHPKNQTVC